MPTVPRRVILHAMRWFAVVGVVGACADVPTNSPFDGLQGLQASFDTAFHVTGDGYRLDFGSADRTDAFAMPRSIVANGFELLADHPMCNKEAGSGLAFYPGLDITAFPDHLGTMGVAAQSSIVQTPGMTGPGALQFTVSYDARYFSMGSAPDDTEHFIGTSIFTIFVGQRIVRHDRFTPFQSPNPLGQRAIGCQGLPNNENFFITTYWTFDGTVGSTATNGDPLSGRGPGAGCVVYQSPPVGVATNWPTDRAVGGPRYDTNGTMHIFDFIDETVPAPPGEHSVTSALRIGLAIDAANKAQACQDMLSGLVDVPLMVGTNMVTSDSNGIFTDTRPHTGKFTIAPIDADAPLGTAIAVDLGDLRHAHVTRDPPASDPPAFIQRLDDRRVLFVVRDRLAVGESLTIDPF